MQTQQVKAIIGKTPYMTVERAEHLWQVVVAGKFSKLLELGTYHGTSACYLGSALHELGCGQITTLDRVRTQEIHPTPEELVQSTGLQSYVTIRADIGGYHWPLFQYLQAEERFDLIYIDGAHTIEQDSGSYAFCRHLSDILVFDDLNWRPATSPSHKGSNKPTEWMELKHMREIFNLLARPDYKWWIDYGDWGVVGRGKGYDWFRAAEQKKPEATG